MEESVYRIGEVAARTGVTTRTIRYYEELGLLGESDREKGRHRLYCETDVVRLRELIRLRDLLGVPLEELKRLLERDSAESIDALLELVCARHRELECLEDELVERRRTIQARSGNARSRNT
jgi:DNA-binding transcriptional MerR regulator